MDLLAQFLDGARWCQTGQSTFFCDDPKLETIWVNVAEQLPSQLRGCGLQAWKITGTTKMVQPKGFIKPISGTGTIVGGQTLDSESDPISFENEIILSGSLKFILAIPQSSSSSE